MGPIFKTEYIRVKWRRNKYYIKFTICMLTWIFQLHIMNYPLWSTIRCVWRYPFIDISWLTQGSQIRHYELSIQITSWVSLIPPEACDWSLSLCLLHINLVITTAQWAPNHEESMITNQWNWHNRTWLSGAERSSGPETSITILLAGHAQSLRQVSFLIPDQHFGIRHVPRVSANLRRINFCPITNAAFDDELHLFKFLFILLSSAAQKK